MDTQSSTYRIEGIVVEKSTGRGLVGLQVEAWDKDLLVDDYLGQAETNIDGGFVIRFTPSEFKDLYGEKRPDLFFKVFQDDQMIHSTEKSVLWNVDREDIKVVIEIESSEDEINLIYQSPIEGTTRSVSKATYTPRKTRESERKLSGRGVEKAALIRKLAPTIDELEALDNIYRRDEDNLDNKLTINKEEYFRTLDVITNSLSISGKVDKPRAAIQYSQVDVDSFIQVTQDIISLRREKLDDPSQIHQLEQLQAYVALEAENLNTVPVGYLHLERLSFTPAGIERGELIYTVPLSPGEEVNISHKEWSNTSEEFERIVTDYMEEFSEEGVTEKSELAQSVNNQNQHSSAINAGVTVSAQYSGVQISSNFGYNASDSATKSEQLSRNYSAELTSKASSRSKQEHKISFKVASAAGTEDQTVRLIKNPFADRATRVDYFQLIRKWRVNLYRYGIRLTWDIIVPEPGSELLSIFWEIKQIRAALELGFECPIDIINWPGFILTPTDMLPEDEVDPEQGQKDYLTWAGIYLAVLGDDDIAPGFEETDQYGWGLDFQDDTDNQAIIRLIEFDTREKFLDYEIESAEFGFAGLLGWTGEEGEAPTDASITVRDLSTGTILYQLMNIDMVNPEDLPDEYVEIQPDGTKELKDEYESTPYIRHNIQQYEGWRKRSGKFILSVRTLRAKDLQISMSLNLHLKSRNKQAWQQRVWNKIHDAAQTTYLEKRQHLKSRLARLEEELGAQDALSLRKREHEEVMRCALKALGKDPLVIHGDAEAIKLLQQSIEWENMLYFLYPYFWSDPNTPLVSQGKEKISEDIDEKNNYWEFKKYLDHPDPLHRAFLKSGAARVVLTIRPGFEEAFLAFINGANNNIPDPPYLSIGEEFKAFAMTNYPGIPPANPIMSVRPQFHLKQKQAWQEMQWLIRLLDAFKISNHRYPTQTEGLLALKPYFPMKDPWGGSYIYQCPSDEPDKRGYDLFTYGADGKPGDEGENIENKDIKSWEDDPKSLATKNMVKAWEDMQMFMDLLEKFYQHNGRYPSTQEGLDVLWQVLPMTDPWKNPYYYKSPGDFLEYDLISFGADGKPGGEDLNADITNWAEASLIGTWFEYTPTSALDIEFDQKNPAI